MEFQNPWAWLLLLVVPPIIAFYFLKTRRRDTISTTSFFWEEIAEERRLRSLGPRFRNPFSLFLALLFVSLMIFAALDPVCSGQRGVRRTIFVFDNSASMNAVDRQGRSRFDRAHAELLRAVSQMESGRTAALITASDEPEIALGFTDHRPTLREAVLALRKTDASTALDRAIEIAKILAQNADDARIVVFSDTYPIADASTGNDEKADTRDDANGSVPVNVFFVGEPLGNVAVTRFDVRRSRTEATGFEVFTEVANFSEMPVSLRLALELAPESQPESQPDRIGHEAEDGIIVLDMVPLSLEPGAKEIVTTRGHDERGAVLTASLTVDMEGDAKSGGVSFHDALDADNRAQVQLPPRRELKILLHGQGTEETVDENADSESLDIRDTPSSTRFAASRYFLRKALESQINVAVETITEVPRSIDADTLLVFHGTIPATLPDGNVLIVDPGNGCDLFSVGEPIASPIIGIVDKDAALLKSIRLDDVSVPGARHLSFSSQKAPRILLATPENDAILLQWDFSSGKSSEPRTDRRGGVVLLTADLGRGDLTLRTAFPILLSNILNAFRDHDDAVGGGDKADGAGTPSVFAETEESDLGFSLSSTLNENAGAEGDASSGEPVSAAIGAVSRPLRFWAVVAAILLLLLDWFLYHRRWAG